MIELAGAVIFFVLTAFALLFSLTKSSQIDGDSFPNRGRFYAGLIIWIVTAILAVFMSFPGYADWFLPVVYPFLKGGFLTLFVIGFFLILTTLIAFPQHMNYYRREIDGRSDRIALLENIRQIASQPYPITELFTLVLKELGSFLVIKKGAVFMINPSKREMYLAAQIGLDKDELSRLERFAMGRDLISKAALEQTPVVSGDLASSDNASRKLLLAGRDLTMSAAALPLSSRDRSLGALLVISDQPYRFEKRDRMLLMATAEAVAGVVEANRLSRDNQKLTRRLEDNTKDLNNLRESINEVARSADAPKPITSICRHLIETYELQAGRIVKIAEGDLIDIAGFEIDPDASSQSESYRIAVIDAIRRKKMVVLNQEARNREGGTYISRSALLCPFALRSPDEYALLLEAPGNGLPLNDTFLSDVESVINLITITLDKTDLKETGTLNQATAKTLLRILKIKTEATHQEILKSFIEEIKSLLSADSSILVFIRDKRNQYCILDVGQAVPVQLAETIFMPGEGPVGRVAATGEVLEFADRSQVEKGWSGLDHVNQDFLNYLGGEKATPDYQLNIPVTVLEDVVAVIAMYSYSLASRPAEKEKAMLLLAAQLLSIRMSMAGIKDRGSIDVGDKISPEARTTLIDITESLATIIGQAELLEGQTDISGQARFAAGEILKAAEQASRAMKNIQDKTVSSESQTDSSSGPDKLTHRLNLFLENHSVTGDLYMFDNNRTVMLKKDLADPYPFVPRNDQLSAILENVLNYFITLQDEGDEVLLKSCLHGEYFYLSLVRGSREKHKQFDPVARDFGAPDVLPPEIADENMIKALAENSGEVSFDRFGRRPTYLSFRFPCHDVSGEIPIEKPASTVAGLRILAIDDQQMILDLLSGICQSLGLELTALRDPVRGVELFKQQRYDIVMVDLAVGQISGWDIARAVKQHSADTPVIMMTGWGVNIDQERAERGGVDFTLAKPFKIEQLTGVFARAKTKLHSS